jgi:hypothetical protein
MRIAAFLAASLIASAAAAQSDHTVYFGFNADDLSPDARATVDAAAADFRETGSTSISIVGHTDTVGSDEYNRALSERRAEAVRDAMVAQGVPASEITLAWRGEQDLAVQTGEGVRERLNRRAEISVGAGAAPMEPAPAPEPEPMMLGLSFGLGPYLGINMQQGDESEFIGGNLTVSYAATNNIALSAEQAVFYTNDAIDDGWGGRSAVGLDFYALGMNNAGVTPYIGANAGWIYVDGTAKGGFFGGPEAGLEYRGFVAKAAYDFVEDRDAEDGVVSLTISYNLKF